MAVCTCFQPGSFNMRYRSAYNIEALCSSTSPQVFKGNTDTIVGKCSHKCVPPFYPHWLLLIIDSSVRRRPAMMVTFTGMCGMLRHLRSHRGFYWTPLSSSSKLRCARICLMVAATQGLGSQAGAPTSPNDRAYPSHHHLSPSV